jgi:hypothetical protein
MNGLDRRFTISPNVIFQEVQLGESILLDTSTVTYFAFDPLGTRIWQAMQETDDLGAVLGRVAPDSGLSLAELERVLDSIVAGLERGGLIRIM